MILNAILFCVMLFLMFLGCVVDIWCNWEKDEDGSYNFPIFATVVLFGAFCFVMQAAGIFKFIYFTRRKAHRITNIQKYVAGRICFLLKFLHK